MAKGILNNPANARSVEAPLGVRRIDSMRRYSIPRPRRIAGKIPWVIPAKNSPYRTVHCMACSLPSLWYDKRVREQFNSCVHCDTPHQMIVNNWGEVKKRIINQIPEGYNEPTPTVERK